MVVNFDSSFSSPLIEFDHGLQSYFVGGYLLGQAQPQCRIQSVATDDSHGPLGIVLGSCFWTFPHALMILLTALSQADARHYEAAEVLGASTWRTFFTVTLPMKGENDED